MVELIDDGLNFSFPEVHPQARLRIEFQRTLRIPDDDQVHYLPPGLGTFPLTHVDDVGPRVPSAWVAHGGVLLPMYQSEAVWIHLDGTWVDRHDTAYPFAVKVAAGKIDAVTGQPWTTDLHARPQDYLVVPDQPWLDGFCVEKGVIRQFVAMPLGRGLHRRGTSDRDGGVWEAPDPRPSHATRCLRASLSRASRGCVCGSIRGRRVLGAREP